MGLGSVTVENGSGDDIDEETSYGRDRGIE